MSNYLLTPNSLISSYCTGEKKSKLYSMVYKKTIFWCLCLSFHVIIFWFPQTVVRSTSLCSSDISPLFSLWALAAAGLLGLFFLGLLPYLASSPPPTITIIGFILSFRPYHKCHLPCTISKVGHPIYFQFVS